MSFLTCVLKHFKYYAWHTCVHILVFKIWFWGDQVWWSVSLLKIIQNEAYLVFGIRVSNHACTDFILNGVKFWCNICNEGCQGMTFHHVVHVFALRLSWIASWQPFFFFFSENPCNSERAAETQKRTGTVSFIDSGFFFLSFFAFPLDSWWYHFNKGRNVH